MLAVRFCLRKWPRACPTWVAQWPFEVSLVVLTASQALALGLTFASGADMSNGAMPSWTTAAVAAAFAVSAILLTVALVVDNAGLMATALRATCVVMATLIGMVIPGGLSSPEVVMIVQVVPYMVLTAARALYVELVWRSARELRAG